MNWRDERVEPTRISLWCATLGRYLTLDAYLAWSRSEEARLAAAERAQQTYRARLRAA